MDAMSGSETWPQKVTVAANRVYASLDELVEQAITWFTAMTPLDRLGRCALPPPSSTGSLLNVGWTVALIQIANNYRAWLQRSTGKNLRQHHDTVRAPSHQPFGLRLVQSTPGVVGHHCSINMVMTTGSECE